jgi:hypothetical protein
LNGLKNSFNRRGDLGEESIRDELREFFIFPEKLYLEGSGGVVSIVHEICHMDLRSYKKRLGR